MAFNVQAIKDTKKRVREYEGIIRYISGWRSTVQAFREANRKLNLLNNLT